MTDYIDREDLNDEERARINECVTAIAELRADISRNHKDISTLWHEFNNTVTLSGNRGAYGYSKRDPRVIQTEIRKASITACVNESAISELRYRILNVYSENARRLIAESHSKPNGTVLVH